VGRLTTHVLDTARGRPAEGLTIELWRLDRAGERRVPLRIVRTNAGGRTDVPLLEGDALAAGTYELVFAVGDYFAEHGLATVDPPFLDRVPVRFGIADPDAHYHVPLLFSPWAYSTYRGS
jgi:5-hydroxyisourate hydrolase